MKGWIDLEAAAERVSQRRRQKPFRSLGKGDAKKVLRELRDLVICGYVTAQVADDQTRYRQLDTSDALSHPFGIHFDLDGSIGAETVFNPEKLRPMLLREADFEAQLQLAPAAPPTPPTVWLEFDDLKAKGVKIGRSRIRELEKTNEFPIRKKHTPDSRRPVWAEHEIEAWVANPNK